MRYSDRPGMSGVERFMRHYFLIAKKVGDLTGMFLAHLDEKFATRSRRFGLPSILLSPKKLNGFMLALGKLAVPTAEFFSEEPVWMIRHFHLPDQHGLPNNTTQMS